MNIRNNSAIILLTHDAELLSQVTRILENDGWNCSATDSGETLIDWAAGLVDIMVIDGQIDRPLRQSLIAQVRALDGFASSLPIITYAGEADEDMRGVNDRLGAPLDEAALRAVIEYWAGPVGDHFYRDPEAPHYRLLRLGGREMMTSTFERFAASLHDALARIERGEPPQPIAHQIAGIAGMMGYAKLGRLWSLVDQGMIEHLPEAKGTTRNVLAILDGIRRF